MPAATTSAIAPAISGRILSSQPAGTACCSSRNRTAIRVSKYGDTSGASHVSINAIVASSSFSSFPHSAQLSTCARTSAGACFGARSRSGKFACTLRQIIKSPNSQFSSILFHELLQPLPQRLIRPEQQRLRCRLAQPKDPANLLVIQPLILVHQDRCPLPLRQRHHMLADRLHPLVLYHLLFGAR